MENKNKYSKSTIVLATLLIIAVVLSASVGTYAWLMRESLINNKTVISDFEIQGFVYFLPGKDDENKLTIKEILNTQPASYFKDTSVISVNVSDENANNYIGKLRVVLRFSGASPAYIRLRVLEEWSENEEFIYSTFPNYNIPIKSEIFAETSDGNLIPTYNNQEGTGWFDNRKNDYCYYYDAPIYPNTKSGTVNMLAINGLSKSALNDLANLRNTVELNMTISADAVQPNRYRELFNIDELPWLVK